MKWVESVADRDATWNTGLLSEVYTLMVCSPVPPEGRANGLRGAPPGVEQARKTDGERGAGPCFLYSGT